MGIQLSWDDDTHSIIYWRFEDRWTIEHLEAAVVKNREMLDTVSERVDLILDISRGGLVPLNLVRFIRYYRITPHPLSYLKILVGADDYLQLLWRNIAPFAPRHLQIEFADSLDEARKMIAQDREAVTTPS